MIEWSRPFDVDSDNSMTLVANEKFKIWMMWGLFFNERSTYEPYLKGATTESDGLDWIIHPAPELIVGNGTIKNKYYYSFIIFAAIYNIF